MVNYDTLCRDLKSQIDNLEREISAREHEMCAVEAKIFYEDLMSVHEKLIEYKPEVTEWRLSTDIRISHLTTTKLKIKLAKIFSSTKSTLPTKTNVNNQSSPTKQAESVKNADLLIRKQSFIIKRIESLEIHNDTCVIQAEVLYSHLTQLYDSFISNQIQIETRLDDNATLENQQKIATEVQQKVIDLQTKLKKIMQPIPTSLKESTTSIDHSSQPTRSDTGANLNSLFQKGESLIKRMSSLEPKEDLCPEKAEIMYNHLNSLYHSFNSNQTEIESQVSGSTLDSQLEISKQIQNKVIELQTTFKKIFAPIIIPSSSMQLKALPSEQIRSSESESNLRAIELKLSNLITLCNDRLESRSNIDEIASNISNSTFTSLELDDQLEISKDIQNKTVFLQTTLRELLDSNKHHEKNTSDKLDKILGVIERQKQLDDESKRYQKSSG